MNKKGFVLTETLMVTVFIIVIFTFVYTAVIPLFGIYRDKADRENNIDIAYKLYHIRKMIKQDANEEAIIRTDLRRVDCTDLVNQEYCNNLMSYLDLNQYDIIFTKSISENFDSIKGINKEIEEYIKPYRESNEPCLILLDKERHTIVHLNYNNKNVMGSFGSFESKVIYNNKNNITKVYFKKEPTITINAKYRNIDSSLKQDLTWNNQGRVLAWLENDPDNTGKYILYIESNDKTYLRTCNSLFDDFRSLKEIVFSNVDTSLANDMSSMFFNCNSLERLDLSSFDTSKVTNFVSMFRKCNNLSELNISSFNTKLATTMSYMFAGCEKLTNLDLSNFDTSQVQYMNFMFSLCKNLSTSGFNISSFNTKNVIEMLRMFESCNSLTKLDLSNFDTRNVKNMSGMFFGCGNLKDLNVSSFNTKNVIDMSTMFSNCINISTLNLGNFDTSNVEKMFMMFLRCENLVSINVSKFNTSKVTDMSCMFSECHNLSELDVSRFVTENVTNMELMFSECSNLKVLNLKSFNTSNVTNMNGMFDYCSNLETIYVSNQFTTSQLPDINYPIFRSDEKLTGGNGTKFSFDDAIYARIDDPDNDRPGYFTLWT